MIACVGALGCLFLLLQNTIRVPTDAPTIQAGDRRGAAFRHGARRAWHVRRDDRLPRQADHGAQRVRGREATIIDGGDGSHLPVVSFRNGEGPESVLRGFTVTGGDNRSADDWGGGISCAGDLSPFTSPAIAGASASSRINTTGLAGGGVAGNPVLEDCKTPRTGRPPARGRRSVGRARDAAAASCPATGPTTAAACTSSRGAPGAC
jgi:hypothetical protein